MAVAAIGPLGRQRPFFLFSFFFHFKTVVIVEGIPCNGGTPTKQACNYMPGYVSLGFNYVYLVTEGRNFIICSKACLGDWLSKGLPEPAIGKGAGGGG